MNKEYVLKNNSMKKTEIVLSDVEIVKDSIKEFVYSNFKGDCFVVNFFGEIDNNFRAVAIIGQSSNESAIFNANLSEFDKKFTFGIFDIKKEIPKSKHCHLLKLDQNDILHKILQYMSYEKFEGGYYAKGKIIGNTQKDLQFIGVSGDINNEKFINSINLDEAYISMPKLTKKNGFYISKFI